MSDTSLGIVWLVPDTEPIALSARCSSILFQIMNIAHLGS